jgi:glycerophosphoryl diester phosphodiesterase
MKKQNKEILKICLILKSILTIYLVAGLLIVPGIDRVSAETVYGAHRGASVDFEENTIEAFEKAIEDEKYKFIEFDIQYSKDGEIVVFHENNRFRFPKKGVSTPDMTYDELNDKFEFDIPVYEEVMEVVAGEKPLNIEIKSHGDLEQDKKLVDFIVKDCEERGLTNQIIISVISNDVLFYITEEYPEIKTGKVYFVTMDSLIPISEFSDDVYDTPADYILLHGYNIRNYSTLIESKPEDKTLIFWYFTDESYIVKDKPDCEFWKDC